MAFVNFFYKMDIDNMLYYCLSCNFVVHLNCAINNGNKKYINLLELNNEEFTQSKSMLEIKIQSSINPSNQQLAKKKKSMWT